MGVILGVLAKIFFAITGRWLGAEIGAQHKPLCAWLVKFAAARLPEEEQVAAESEWLAVIEDLRSPTAQFVHSLSFAVSSLRIRRAVQPSEWKKVWAFRSMLAVNVTSMLSTTIIGPIRGMRIIDGYLGVGGLCRTLSQSSFSVRVAVLGLLAAMLVFFSYVLYRAIIQLLTRFEGLFRLLRRS
jgi:hypothetical protein